MRGFEVSVSGSEVEKDEVVQEARQYRVRVCLQRFFSDERARCYVWVSGSQRVRWLTARLRRLFPLPPALALLSRGHLLPPSEPLAVLAPDDPIDVIRIPEDRHTDEKSEADEVESGGGDELESTSEPTLDKRVLLDVSLPVAAPTATDEVDSLVAMKRRALRLLEEVSGVSPARASRRRRRVRRRRARPSSDPCDPCESRVSRNVGAAAREPRAVHALSAAEL